MTLPDAPNAEDIKFAKAMVNPDKRIRDETLQTLQAFLCKQANESCIDQLVCDKDGQKLWKALYYTLWLADKAAIQQELTSSLVGLLDYLPSTTGQVAFLGSAFQIILREWPGLDQYRVNKFYTLLRQLLRKLLVLASEDTCFRGQIMSILHSELLCKKPNGPRYHIADIFLTELCAVPRNPAQTNSTTHSTTTHSTNQPLNTELFMEFLSPFLRDLVRVDDAAWHQRVIKSVFIAFIQEHTEQLPAVNARVLQRKLFDMAADPDTPDQYRSALYSLHKVYARTTGKAFIEDGSDLVDAPAAAVAAPEPEVMAEEEEEEEEEVVAETPKKRRGRPAKAATPSATPAATPAKKTPSKAKAAPVEEVTESEAEPEVPVKGKPGRKKKVTIAEVEAEEAPAAAVEAEPLAKRTRRSSSKA